MKLGINRKRGHVVDQLGENTYVIEYDDGKVEPVNIERLYILLRESNVRKHSDNSRHVKKGKNSRRNFKKRQRRRNKRNNISQPPNKRRRVYTVSSFDSGRGKF